MYTPPAYNESNRALLHRRMREWSFATLVTHGSSGSNATHLPFLLDSELESQGLLTTHFARNNAQLRDLQEGSEALVIFQGPHAFITPSWYENRNTFPTWNYTAIHVKGMPRLIEDPEAIRQVLHRTVAHYDTPLGGVWTFEGMPESMTAPRLKAIVAIEIPIATLEGKMKLNQDKSQADRDGVIAALERIGEPEGVAVARLMRELPRKD